MRGYALQRADSVDFTAEPRLFVGILMHVSMGNDYANELVMLGTNDRERCDVPASSSAPQRQHRTVRLPNDMRRRRSEEESVRRTASVQAYHDEVGVVVCRSRQD